jgi:MFS-type transporter involved in bile tolerance (Atg22 family)
MEHTNGSTFSIAGLGALAFAASLGAACDRLGERTQIAAAPMSP